MKKEKLNEFLDTKKSKVNLEDISPEKLNPFIDAMLYAEKHVSNQMSESKEEEVEETDPEDTTHDELQVIQKSLADKTLKTFLRNN